MSYGKARGKNRAAVQPCLPCAATGRDFERPLKVCQWCHGRGWIVSRSESLVLRVPVEFFAA